MKLYVADRETGTFIEQVSSLQEGLELIREFEENDRQEGTFQEGFYDVVNEYHCSII